MESKTPKFDEIYYAVCELEYSFFEKYETNERPKISVYIDRRHYCDVLVEIEGKVCANAYYFDQYKTVRGYPVFEVLAPRNENIDFECHPLWRVVLVSDDSVKEVQNGSSHD